MSITEILAGTDRTAAAEALQDLAKSDLLAVAAAHGVIIRAGATKAGIARAIIDQTVGCRADAAAIRGGAW